MCFEFFCRNIRWVMVQVCNLLFLTSPECVYIFISISCISWLSAVSINVCDWLAHSHVFTCKWTEVRVQTIPEGSGSLFQRSCPSSSRGRKGCVGKKGLRSERGRNISRCVSKQSKIKNNFHSLLFYRLVIMNSVCSSSFLLRWFLQHFSPSNSMLTSRKLLITDLKRERKQLQIIHSTSCAPGKRLDKVVPARSKYVSARNWGYCFPSCPFNHEESWRTKSSSLLIPSSILDTVWKTIKVKSSDERKKISHYIAIRAWDRKVFSPSLT